jgi:hypothetical protein
MKVTLDTKPEKVKTGLFSSAETVVCRLTIELSEEEKHIIKEDKLDDLYVAERAKADHELDGSEKYQRKHLKDFQAPTIHIVLGDFLYQHTHEHFFDSMAAAQNFEGDVMKGLKHAKARMTDRVQAADLGPKTYEL